MKRPVNPLRDTSGASAVEFAILAPAFVFLINGIVQIGIVLFANAGLNNALAEGARYATIFPRPTESQVTALINKKRWGLDAESLEIEPFVEGTSPDGAPYIDIGMTYDVDMNLIFLDLDPITLRQERRVYLYS